MCSSHLDEVRRYAKMMEGNPRAVGREERKDNLSHDELTILPASDSSQNQINHLSMSHILSCYYIKSQQLKKEQQAYPKMLKCEKLRIESTSQ